MRHILESTTDRETLHQIFATMWAMLDASVNTPEAGTLAPQQAGLESTDRATSREFIQDRRLER